MAKKTHSSSRTALAVHGGAGTMPRAKISPAGGALRSALAAGANASEARRLELRCGDGRRRGLRRCAAVQCARGAVFNSDGEHEHELDAAVMTGAHRRAGALAALRSAKNCSRAP
jgi:beta-aspartyl-peptidase (threonine type)